MHINTVIIIYLNLVCVMLHVHSADLPLTLRNVVEAVKKVKKWRDLGRWLCVKDSLIHDSFSTRSEFERRHSSTDDRRTGVIEYWLLTAPTPSWRRLIQALDGMGEHEVADMVRPYAEPITGMTCTLMGSIVGKKVPVCQRAIGPQ